jgi:hypothetical protein
MSDSGISTQIVSYVALAIAIGGMLCGVINHRRLTSRCGQRTPIIVSLDIDATTPRGDKVEATKPTVI